VPEDEKPDYIAIHVYTTTFESFRSKVESFWNTFHIPIWVTEFAMTVCPNLYSCPGTCLVLIRVEL
jgi:hypothetical protein